jgi:hypothetical protein
VKKRNRFACDLSFVVDQTARRVMRHCAFIVHTFAIHSEVFRSITFTTFAAALSWSAA